MYKLFYHIIEKLYLKMPGNLAYFDDMTGVNNRQYYNRVMKTKYLRKELFVYFLDIDNIKEINDTLGHAFGSAEIKRVADTLRAENSLIEIARIGGDEFIALSYNQIELNIKGASVGVEHKEKWEDLSSCVHRADEAMYREKELHHKSPVESTIDDAQK